MGYKGVQGTANKHTRIRAITSNVVVLVADGIPDSKHEHAKKSGSRIKTKQEESRRKERKKARKQGRKEDPSSLVLPVLIYVSVTSLLSTLPVPTSVLIVSLLLSLLPWLFTMSFYVLKWSLLLLRTNKNQNIKVFFRT